MEKNKFKAIAGVPMPGSYFLPNYFSNAHPLLNVVIKIENYKIYSCMKIINNSLEHFILRQKRGNLLVGVEPNAFSFAGQAP